MRLHFRQHGSGAPLLLLHGLFGSLDNWTPISRRLADRYHVFAVDLRNHGLSPHDAQMNYHLMAGDLRHFMDDHHLARAHVMGHSMGGKTAMQFAMLHPERIGRMIVADIAPRGYPPAHDGVFNALSGLHLPSFKSRAGIEEALAPEIPSLAVRRFLLKNLARDPGGGYRWKFNLPALQANYASLGAPLESDRPSPVPALFLSGERSEYIRESDVPEIFRLFPESGIRVVPDAGHWIHAEAPEVFTHFVGQFLDQHPEIGR